MHSLQRLCRSPVLGRDHCLSFCCWPPSPGPVGPWAPEGLRHAVRFPQDLLEQVGDRRTGKVVSVWVRVRPPPHPLRHGCVISDKSLELSVPPPWSGQNTPWRGGHCKKSSRHAHTARPWSPGHGSAVYLLVAAGTSPHHIPGPVGRCDPELRHLSSRVQMPPTWARSSPTEGPAGALPGLWGGGFLIAEAPL